LTIEKTDDVTMASGILNNVPQVILTYNVTRTISESIITTTTTNSLSIFEQVTMTTNGTASTTNTEISPTACFGFVILILATVGGNTLVLLALYLDKRLHSPSFYLIANMAIADLLLGKNKFFSFRF
jgi:capsular polysaccharide biosynthesis protein